ncbi:hypothetical protein Gogos_005893, partial [Gossypium gossypioides]|nr:hypothetical protein [Gossypium gossypioides]
MRLICSKFHFQLFPVSIRNA